MEKELNAQIQQIETPLHETPLDAVV